MARYVDADKLMRRIETEAFRWGEEYDLLQIMGDIEDFPTADVVEVKHGEWINTGSCQVCSICDEEQYGFDNGRKYCPNCGAKMGGQTPQKINHNSLCETETYKVDK